MTITKPSNGRLLIAEPSIIGDVSFNRSVVLLADHSHEGSVGFILNKPLDCTINDLIPELEVDFKVFNGGPVEQDNLYFIHRVPELIPESIEIAEGIFWGGHFETVVELILAGHLTENEICFFLGYSGWESSQLDQELESHSWIVAENIDKKNIFGKCQPTFWREKMIELGGEYLLWSNAPENPAYN